MDVCEQINHVYASLPAFGIARWIGSRLRLGRLLLRVWHQPVERLRAIIQQGGPLVMRATERGRVEMERAAAQLPPLPAFPGAPTVTLHILTGRRYWYQTAFCLRSFVAHAQVNLDAVLHDDDSIDSALRQDIERFAPRARVLAQSDALERLNQFLPESKYPALHRLWGNYPNIRKLIAPHVGSSGWKLVIDSDSAILSSPRIPARLASGTRQTTPRCG